VTKNTRAVLARTICAVLGIALAGCATRARPIDITPRVALQPNKNEVSMQVKPGKAIGEIVPVDISAANGTDEPYLVVPAQVFAIDQQGQRILPVPPAEAIQEAGDADALKAGLTGAAKNAAIGLVAGAVVGGAIGVVAGALIGAPAEGLAYGAAMGGGVGAAEAGVAGGIQGQVAAKQDAQTQITSLALQASELNPNFSTNGYVFFPKGSYQSVQMTMLNEERHESQTLTAPWPADGAMPQEASIQETTADSPRVLVAPQAPPPPETQTTSSSSNAIKPPVAASAANPVHNPNTDLQTDFDRW
jgi:hypothetical protein